jgi:hypothetical protein
MGLVTSKLTTLPPSFVQEYLTTNRRFDADVRPLYLQVTDFLFISHQNSSIVEFFSMLKKDDPGKQLVYYQVRIV